MTEKDCVLFHIERGCGTVDSFRKGDLIAFRGKPAVIIDVPDTVMGHFKETTDGLIICLDICTIMLDGEIKNVPTDHVFHIT